MQGVAEYGTAIPRLDKRYRICTNRIKMFPCIASRIEHWFNALAAMGILSASTWV